VRPFGRLTGREPLITEESLHIVVNASAACSNAKARRDLGYGRHPLEETLSDTFDWMRAATTFNGSFDILARLAVHTSLCPLRQHRQDAFRVIGAALLVGCKKRLSKY